MKNTDEIISRIKRASRVYIETEALLQSDRLTELLTALFCNDVTNRLIVTSKVDKELCDALYDKNTEKQAEEAMTLMALCSERFTYEKETLSGKPEVDAGLLNVLLKYWDTENKLVITGSEKKKEQLNLINTVALFDKYPVQIVNLNG